jgi:hypothetical protein
MRAGGMTLAMGALVGAVFVASTLPGREAAAAGPDPRLACVEASERGQTLRDQRHLREARAAFVSCARPICPEVVQRDCSAWLTSVDASVPTVVVRALGLDGQDLFAARVTIDGAPFLEKLDGSAAPLDPGKHVIVVSSDGLADVRQEVLIGQGEKNRILMARFTATTEAKAGPSASGTSEARATVAPATWIVGGVAVAALASFTGFGIAALDEKSDLDSGCAKTHSCTSSDKNTLFARALGADLSLGAAVVAGGLAAFFQWKHASVGAAPVAGGAMASGTLRF